MRNWLWSLDFCGFLPLQKSAQLPVTSDENAAQLPPTVVPSCRVSVLMDVGMVSKCSLHKEKIMLDRSHDEAMVEQFRADPSYALALLTEVFLAGSPEEQTIVLRQISAAFGSK